MKLVDLSFKKINDEEARHLSTCMTGMEELRICYCDITEKRLKILSPAIKNLRKPVMSFILILLHA